MCRASAALILWSMLAVGCSPPEQQPAPCINATPPDCCIGGCEGSVIQPAICGTSGWRCPSGVLLTTCPITTRPRCSGPGQADAGMPDAGSTDGGSTDAGADAGTLDAGASDAGEPDAGGPGADASVDAGPADAGPPISFVSVSAGGYFRAGALAAEGSVYVWGQERASNTIRLIPTPLDVGDGGPRFAALSTGGINSCAMTDAGEAWCWGFAVPVNGQLVASDNPRPVWGHFSEVSVSQGLGAQMCGVGDGGVYCWGNLQSGLASADPVLVLGSSGFRKVTCGEGHSCALDDAGAAFCWGDNGHGQLGSGSSAFQSPVPLPVAGGHTFASISAGVFHTCAVTTAGVGYCWGGLGAVDGGLRSDPTPTPFLVSGFTFSDISAGWDWSCGLELDGGAVCWSSSVNQFPNSLRPVRIDGGIRFSTVSTGTAFACGRGLDGLVYCWGFGPLGNGSWGPSEVPVPVAGQ